MHTRKSILILALAGLLLGLTVYYGWAFFRANEKIRLYLVAKLQPVLNQNFKVAELQMSLGALHLKNVSFTFRQDSLWIKDVRVGYRFISLFRKGFHPEFLTNDLRLTQPWLFLRVKSGTPAPRPDSLLNAPFSGAQIQKQIQAFDFVRQLTISHGAIFLVDSLAQTVRLGDEINGWITAFDSQAVAQIEGKVFSSPDKNFWLLARLNLLTAQLFQFELTLNQFHLTDLPTFLLPQAKFSRGILDARLSLARDTQQTLTGHAKITNGAFDWSNPSLVIDSINLALSIQNQDLFIDSACARLNGAPFYLSGQVQNVLAPQFDLKFWSAPTQISQLLTLLTTQPAATIHGNANWQFDLTGSLKRPIVAGKLFLPNFSFGQQAGNWLQVHFGYQDAVFSIKKLRGKLWQQSVKGEGAILNIPTQPDVHGNLQFLGNWPEITTHATRTSRFQVNLNLRGSLSDLLAAGNFKIELLASTQPKITLLGTVAYQNGALGLQSQSQNSGDFNFSGEVKQLFQKMEVNFKLNNCQRLLDWCAPGFSSWLKPLVTNLEVKGELRHLQVDADISRYNRQLLMVLKGEINKVDTTYQISSAMLLNGNYRTPVSARLYGRITPGLIAIDTVRMADFLVFKGKLERTGERALDANLVLNHAPLNTLLSLVDPQSESEMTGRLSSQIAFRGNWQNPHITGSLALRDGTFNKVGTYESELSFNLENMVVLLDNFSLLQNKERLISGRGFYNYRTRATHWQFSGRNVPIADFIKACWNKTDLLAGRGNFDIAIRHQLDQPQIEAELQVSEGKLYRFNFDTLVCSLGNGQPGYSEGKSNSSRKFLPNLIFKRFDLIRNDEFRLQAKGFIPLDRQREMDVKLKGQGNFLALLPDLTSYFRETRSHGELQFQLRGRPGSPRIGQAELSLKDGFLHVNSVFDKINAIRCHLRLDPEQNFLHLIELSGELRGEHLRLHNVEQTAISGRRPLRPFEIIDWGLNLGILVLETSPKGIPLNIPGVMERGERGWFEAKGWKDDESFYFAGPWERPVVRGRLNLRSVNFTFPFLETEVDSESVVVKVLERIDWDVRVFSIKDTRYVRRIYGAADVVNVNLILNEHGEGLYFKGAVGDESLLLDGTVASNRGNVEYLDFVFRIEEAAARFDRTSIFPIVWGRARTTVIDSLGFSNNLWLMLYVIDPITHEKQEKGRWDEPNLYFELTSANVNLGSNEAQILASLGYSARNLRLKAPDILGISADNILLKPIFRPFERKMEQLLGLDFVQIRSRVARNLLEQNFSRKPVYESSHYTLLRNTRLMLGKYLTDQWFFIYTGELESPMAYHASLPAIGLKHKLGLEYQIQPNFLLEMEYDYNGLLMKNRDDGKVLLRYSFPITR
ncbi:hypothetical protein L0128_06170 [candidate division KSB1 bacterium]|nr:hypothetical protein [candidate division KSB1 bacterium]